METDPRFQRGVQAGRSHLLGLIVLIVVILTVVFVVDCVNRPDSTTTTIATNGADSN